MVSDGQLHADREEVVVPPVEQFLEVTIMPDRQDYEPRDAGRLTVFTRDVDGNPVSAEVAVALVDESVYSIQQPYAGDPRQFFYDRRQAAHIVRTTSTFSLKQYLKLGGRLLGFNVDPEFSNVLDVLIMVDLRRTSRKILNRYMGREGAAAFLAQQRVDARSQAS